MTNTTVARPARSTTMHATVQDRYGSSEVLHPARIERPSIGADEVLEQVRAAGVSRGTWQLMTGKPYLMRLMGFGLRRPKNPVAGQDVAGVVTAVGAGVSRFQPGDQVCGIAAGTVYLLLRRIDRRFAGALVVFVAVGAGLILINLLFHHAAVLVATGPGSAAVGSHRSGGLVVLLLDLHDYGYTITWALFGMWLLALGYPAYQSTVFPRVLSTLLIVSLIVSWLVGLAWPGLPVVVQAILAPHPVADLWLVAYLVTKRGPMPRPARLAPAAVTA